MKKVPDNPHAHKCNHCHWTHIIGGEYYCFHPCKVHLVRDLEEAKRCNHFRIIRVKKLKKRFLNRC